MSQEKDPNSDSSTSESEVSACSSSYNPLKALYSDKTVVPVKNAALYNTVCQFEAAIKHDIVPVGYGEVEQKKNEEKEQKKREEEERVNALNKQRFAKYREAMQNVPKREFKVRNVLTRMDAIEGPLSVLKDCVDKRLRVKIVTRKENGIRGALYATIVAFDKQWNLALSDILEVWKRKGVNKRKIPAEMGTPVPKGTAASISHVPVVTETPLGKGVWECSRHIAQMMVRGEHVVLVNIVER